MLNHRGGSMLSVFWWIELFAELSVSYILFWPINSILWSYNLNQAEFPNLTNKLKFLGIVGAIEEIIVAISLVSYFFFGRNPLSINLFVVVIVVLVLTLEKYIKTIDAIPSGMYPRAHTLAEYCINQRKLFSPFRNKQENYNEVYGHFGEKITWHT